MNTTWHPAWLATSFPYGESPQEMEIWAEALEAYVRANHSYLTENSEECQVGARYLLEICTQHMLYGELRQTLGSTICLLDPTVLVQEIIGDGDEFDFALDCLFKKENSQHCISSDEHNSVIDHLIATGYALGRVCCEESEAAA